MYAHERLSRSRAWIQPRIDRRFKHAAQGKEALHPNETLHQARDQVQQQSIKPQKVQRPTPSGLLQVTPTAYKSQIPCLGLSFSNQTLLSSHHRTISIDPNSNLSLVSFCGKKNLSSSKQLLGHQASKKCRNRRDKGKVHRCRSCNASFDTRHNLNNHICRFK